MKQYNKVTNEYGYEMDFEAAVNMMDADVREQVHRDIAPCTDQEFFDAYCKAHEETFGEPFFLTEPHPVW